MTSFPHKRSSQIIKNQNMKNDERIVQHTPGSQKCPSSTLNNRFVANGTTKKT